MFIYKLTTHSQLVNNFNTHVMSDVDNLLRALQLS